MLYVEPLQYEYKTINIRKTPKNLGSGSKYIIERVCIWWIYKKKNADSMVAVQIAKFAI